MISIGIVGCTVNLTTESHVENVFLADRSSIPIYKQQVKDGIFPRNALAVQFSQQGGNPSFVDGNFCDEQSLLTPFKLFVYDVSKTARSPGHPNEYLVFIEVIARPNRNMDVAYYNLEKSPEDICLHTIGFVGYSQEKGSMLRVPANQIARALLEGVRSLPKLSN